MQFDILEIQKNIEEKRLIWGQKLEKFLIATLHSSIKSFNHILRSFFAQSYSTFAVCALVVLASIFIRSTRDIGQDSAVYIVIVQKILHGGKYYYDFFENNFPLAFYLTIIPVMVADFFSISPIIALEIFVNLVGVLAIYFSALILQRSSDIYSRGQIQLIIICFAIGYFLRIYTLQFNEYGTKSSYLLALAFPYIAYQISRDNSRKTQLISGVLAGLMICLKPHYTFIPIVFEISKLRFKEKNFLLRLFCLRNFTALFLVLGYLALMLKFTPEYFAFLSQFSVLYFSAENIDYFNTIQKNIYPLLLLSVVALPYVSKHKILRPFFCTTIAAALIVIFELINTYDQCSVFFSLSFALIGFIVFFLLQEKKINWRKDSPLILILLVLPQFDVQSFFALIFNLCYFWWIILFFDKKADRCLFVFSFIAIILIIFDKSGQVSWLFSALMFLILFKPSISFLAKKNGPVLYLSKPAIIAISLVLSYFISLFFAAIFNQQNLYAANLKSPNYTNESKAFFITKYAAKNDDEVVTISDTIKGSYPTLNYFNKTNSVPSWHLMPFYKNIYEDNNVKEEIFHKKSANANKALAHAFQALKAQISKPNNKLIFIERKTDQDSWCHIQFLEYYFQDEEFKKIFTKNYIFIDTIIAKKKERAIIDDPFTGKAGKNILGEKEDVTNIFEVYLRK